MKKFLFLILALVLLFSSCSISDIENFDDSGTAIAPPDTSVFGVAFARNESADPYTTPNKLNAELMGLIAEPLFSVSSNFEAIPVLCTDYTYENRTYVLNIKSGVFFSDGSPLTPDDVAYSLRAAMESGSFYSTTLSIIESISSSDRDGTVTIRLKYDNARFPRLLDVPIIKRDTRGNMLPIGTGIYAPNDDLSSLTSRVGHHSGKIARYRAISLVDVASTDELLFEFDNHTVSVLTSDPTSPSPLTPLSASQITNISTARMHYIGFNMRRNIFSDAATRVAIARIIDRESAANGDFALMGCASALPVHPSSTAYSAEIAQNFAYDVNLPVSLSKPIEILVNSESSAKLAVCKRISDTLSRRGVTCTVRALPFNEYAAALASGNFDLYYGEVSLGADFDLTRLLSGPLNYGAWYNPALLSLHSAYLAGDEAREDFFYAFCQNPPFVPILFKNTAMYSQNGFFESASPTMQNTYYDFTNWQVGEMQ